MTWKVGLSSAAIRQLDHIPPRIVPAIIAFLHGPLAQNPYQVGKPLRDEFTGTYSARRGAYRVLYEVDDAEQLVTVVRIAHRSDAYRPR